MSYPVQTFATLDELITYINTQWVTNGVGDITGVVGNNVVNGLGKFIQQYVLNWNKAAIISQTTPYIATSGITVFVGAVPSTVRFGDNVFNEWVFVNTTASNIFFANGLGYFDINFSFTTFLPPKSVVRISKAANNQWVQTGMYGNAISPSIKKPLIGIAGRGLTNDPVVGLGTYQSNDLINFAAANNFEFYALIGGGVWQNFGTDGNQFDFDETTGTMDFLGALTWDNGMTINIDLNQ